MCDFNEVLVAGYVEPHDRPDTLALLERLAVLGVREVKRKSVDDHIHVQENDEFLLAQIDAKLIVPVMINIVDSCRSMGVGLALCKLIINAHGGTLTVDDNVPQGTVFTFSVPAWEIKIHE